MPHATENVCVRHPEAGLMIMLNPAVNYADDDVLVKTYPWAFAKRAASSEIVESVRIEAATAAPGEKRSRSRRP